MVKDGKVKCGRHRASLSYAIRTSVRAVDFVPGLTCPYNSAGGLSHAIPPACGLCHVNKYCRLCTGAHQYESQMQA
eukprot:2092758-Rhodomonas_salina.1